MKVSIFLAHLTELSAQKNVSLTAALKEAKKSGVDYLEIDYRNAHGREAELKSMMDGAGLETGALNAWFDFGKGKQPDLIESALDTAAALNAPQIMAVPGFTEPGDDEAIFLDRLAEGLNDMLDRIEKVLAKFPDGYFDQLNYGYYSGFEINLVNWAVWDELYVYHTDKGYVMNISLDCKNEKVRSKMEDLLIEAIFAATDYKILNYSENFETPPFSESRWKELNPTGFYYIGFRDEDYTNETFKEWKEYVTTPEGLRYAPKDRSQLMLSLIRGDELPEGCIVKADLYCETIREAFDTDGWPEKTTWEEALAKLKGETEQKAA